MFAFLDSSSNVVAVSQSDISVASVQSSHPALGVTSRVENAPAGLRHVSQATAVNCTFHRLESGDGTDLSHYSEQGTLGVYKAAKIRDIDRRTDELIDAGFVFPPGGQTFSLSDKAQAKLNGAFAARNEPEFTYPKEWNTKDDDGTYVLADANAVRSFYLTAVGTVSAHLESGTVLKKQVNAATTTAEVDAVVDTR